MGQPRQDEACLPQAPAHSGVWPAVGRLATEVRLDLGETTPNSPGARRRALEAATQESRALLGALESAHAQLLAQERLAALGRVAADRCSSTWRPTPSRRWPPGGP